MASEKLERFRKEFRDMCRRHDVAGIAIAVEPQNAVYSLRLDSSWTCITQTETEFRLNNMDFPPDQRKEVAGNTVAAVMGGIECLEQVHAQMVQIRSVLSKQFDICFHSKDIRPTKRF